MALKFNTNVAERIKLKVRKFWELISIFAEVVMEKLIGGFFNITNLIFDTLSPGKKSLNRRTISTLVLILINPLSASVALI